MEEEKMKQIFVGAKYEKFEKKVFSIPAFLFGGMYFAYRKLLLYAIIVSFAVTLIDSLASKLLNTGLMIIAMLCVHISIGLYFPLWYRKSYTNKVKKLLSQNSDKSEEEIIKSVQKSGGTSILYIILFIIINSVLMTSFNQFIKLDNTSSNLSHNQNAIISNNKTADIDPSNYKTIENAQITGTATINGVYQMYIGNDNELYNCNVENPELLALVNDYDELSVNIYYIENNDTKTIVKYELYNNVTNENLENIKDEESLIKMLGYYPEGSYEETLTFIKQDGMSGVGFKNDISYTYYDYIFENEDGKSLNFKYKIYNTSENKSGILEENQKYKIHFDVEKNIFDYEYIITDIEKI